MDLGKQKNRVNFDMVRAVLSTTFGVTVRKYDKCNHCRDQSLYTVQA